MLYDLGNSIVFASQILFVCIIVGAIVHSTRGL